MIGKSVRQDLKPEVAHLVDGPIAGFDSHRRVVGIADVGFGVVVGVVHVEDGVLRQEDGRLKAVDGLAIDVPVVDEDQPLLFAAGQYGIAFQFFAEIVSMRIDAEDVDIDRKLKMSLR